MEQKYRKIFIEAFKDNGLDTALVDNIIFNINDKGGYNLDIKDYSKIYNTDIPIIIDSIADNIIRDNFPELFIIE